MAKCGVCEDAPSKYKCPACRLPYCSANCYKTHKESSCNAGAEENKPEAKKEAESTVVGQSILTHDQENDDEEVPLLTKEQLAVLSKSDKIRKALADPELRDRIAAIDQHANRQFELQKALTDPAFARFVYSMMDEVYNVSS